MSLLLNAVITKCTLELAALLKRTLLSRQTATLRTCVERTRTEHTDYETSTDCDFEYGNELAMTTHIPSPRRDTRQTADHRTLEAEICVG